MEIEDGCGGGDGGVAVIAQRRLSSQHSTLRESFLASDLAEQLRSNTNVVTDSDSNLNTNDNGLSNQRPISSLTLGAVLNSDNKPPPTSNIVVRTLLEIIRNDETLHGGSSPKMSLAGSKSWKSFKERLKNKRASLAHSSSSNQNQNPNSRTIVGLSPASQSGVPTLASVIANRNSLRNDSLGRVDNVPFHDLALREVDSSGSPRSGDSFRLSAVLAAEREETRQRLSRDYLVVNDVIINGEGEEQSDMGLQEDQPARMSLMDLLEETDRQAGINGSLYSLDDDDEIDEEEKEEVEIEEPMEESSDMKAEQSCCVCMVRHKGAAFIPCGHTFCRLCCRELWVQRGNCPLCNNFILEVLDIF